MKCDGCKKLIRIKVGGLKRKGCIYDGSIPVDHVEECSHFEEKLKEDKEIDKGRKPLEKKGRIIEEHKEMNTLGINDLGG